VAGRVRRVRLDFALRRASGWVDVAVEPNTNPEALGCPAFARDFPVCTATVTSAGDGYRAAFGWVQLVRSTDGASAGNEFEMDPFEPLGPSSHPFCFFGFAPVFFDAPARRSREDMDWRAETFLCFVPTDTDRREARAILGFSWGFRIREETISVRPPVDLPAVAWDEHRTFLRAEHPGWVFASGYRDH
jgi:hypothetical protein